MTNTSRQPRPIAANWDWQRFGACRSDDGDRFFHPEAERGYARMQRVAEAKAICRRCPVLVKCRHHALTAEEPFGIWGALDERERREAISRRKRFAAV